MVKYAPFMGVYVTFMGNMRPSWKQRQTHGGWVAGYGALLETPVAQASGTRRLPVPQASAPAPAETAPVVPSPRFFLLGAGQVPEALAPSGLYRWRSVNPQGKSGPSRVDLRSESRRRSDLTNWLSEGPSARAHDGREVRGGARRHAPCGPSFSA